MELNQKHAQRMLDQRGVYMWENYLRKNLGGKKGGGGLLEGGVLLETYGTLTYQTAFVLFHSQMARFQAQRCHSHSQIFSQCK